MKTELDPPYFGVVKILSIYIDGNRRVILQAKNLTTLTASTPLADISLSNPDQAATSSNNLFAYRPRFSDDHGSNLAAIFINLEGVFPCIQSLSGYVPICSTYTEEDDGFRRGKALIDSADAGNQWRVFSSTSNTLTYGIAIQDCPEFTPQCFPSHNSFSYYCLLSTERCLLLINS